MLKASKTRPRWLLAAYEYTCVQGWVAQVGWPHEWWDFLSSRGIHVLLASSIFLPTNDDTISISDVGEKFCSGHLCAKQIFQLRINIQLEGVDSRAAWRSCLLSRMEWSEWSGLFGGRNDCGWKKDCYLCQATAVCMMVAPARLSTLNKKCRSQLGSAFFFFSV